MLVFVCELGRGDEDADADGNVCVCVLVLMLTVEMCLRNCQMPTREVSLYILFLLNQLLKFSMVLFFAWFSRKERARKECTLLSPSQKDNFNAFTLQKLTIYPVFLYCFFFLRVCSFLMQ